MSDRKENEECDHDLPDDVVQDALEGLFDTPEWCKEHTDIQERPDWQIYQIRMVWALTEKSPNQLGDYFDLPGNAIKLIVDRQLRADVPGPKACPYIWDEEGSLLTVEALFALVRAMLENSRT